MGVLIIKGVNGYDLQTGNYIYTLLYISKFTTSLTLIIHTYVRHQQNVSMDMKRRHSKTLAIHTVAKIAFY